MDVFRHPYDHRRIGVAATPDPGMVHFEERKVL
jgi:hypothetical protein